MLDFRRLWRCEWNLPRVWILHSVQSQNSAGLVSEAVCVPIIIVHLLENNKTRKWKRKEKMWLKDWLEKRSDFSHDNLWREREMCLPLGCNLFMNPSFCFWWIIGNYYSFYSKRIYDYGRLLCVTSKRSYPVKDVCTTCVAQIVSWVVGCVI